MVRVTIETNLSDDNFSHVGLWYSTLYDLSIEQLESLREYLVNFNELIKFHLNIKTKSCIFCRIEEMDRDCLTEGLYCPIPPVYGDEAQVELMADIGGRTLLM